MEKERIVPEKCPISLKDEILLQVERLSKITTAIESARENQGLTDRYYNWAHGELTKVQVSLMGIALDVERIQSEINIEEDE